MEGLHILGWYSMWKPVYFGLYEWWPIREDEVLLLKAANMDVEVVYSYEQAKSLSPQPTDTHLNYHPIYK